jgi:hypothetical protein
MQAIISDGYTESGYIAAVPRLHPAVRFKYRPLTHEQKTIVIDQIQKKSPAQKSRVIAEQVVKNVSDWDVAGADGKPIEITLANVQRLRPALLDGLYNVVSGWAASDPDPDASEADAAREGDAEYTAMMGGESIGEAKEKADRKNS